MLKSASKNGNRSSVFGAKSKQASVLRQRRHELVRKFGLPAEMLGGALTLTHRRCGKSGCRCATGEGHAMWTLTSSIKGVKDVLVVPADVVPALRPLVLLGREYRKALSEALAINAKLVRLWRAQQGSRKGRRSEARGKARKR